MNSSKRFRIALMVLALVVGGFGLVSMVAELTAAPHVRNVKTSLTLRNSKDAAMVPLDARGVVSSS